MALMDAPLGLEERLFARDPARLYASLQSTSDISRRALSLPHKIKSYIEAFCRL
jgi:hypothetical protein